LIFAGEPRAEYAGAMARVGAEITEMTRNNVALAADFRRPEVVDQLAAWLDRGALGWFAKKDGEVLGYAMLYAVDDEPRLVRHIYLHPGEAGGILFYTRPECRQLGIGPAFVKELSAKAAAIEGVKSYVAWIVPGNRRWAAALRRMGLLPAGEVRVLKFWNRSIMRKVTGSDVKR
jgi:GNAT superfamily N-acetyltransferase